MNSDINNLVKLVLASTILVGCATRPAPPVDLAELNGWQNDCGRARQQVDYLQQRLDAYREYYKDHAVTRESQQYVGKLKNNLWSLRSSCSALQR